MHAPFMYAVCEEVSVCYRLRLCVGGMGGVWAVSGVEALWALLLIKIK